MKKTMPSNKQINAEVVERVIAGLCYLTGGLIGLLYIIISRSQSQSMFFRFHFLQSMIILVLGILISWTNNILQNILGGIFGLLNLATIGSQVVAIIGLVLTLAMKAGSLLLLYGMIWAFLGKYAEIPLISPLVRQNMR